MTDAAPAPDQDPATARSEEPSPPLPSDSPSESAAAPTVEPAVEPTVDPVPEPIAVASPPPVDREALRRARMRADRLADAAAWQRMRAAIGLFAALMLTSMAVAVYVRITGDTSPWSDAVGTAVSALIVLAASAARWRELAPLLRPAALTVRHGLLALGTLVGMGVLVEAWFLLLRHVFPELTYLDAFREHGWPLWSAFVLVSVCPAVFEELAFRGCLLRQFEGLLDRREALLLQAALFAIAHCSVAVLPSHFGMGLALGWLRLRTGSLLPGMGVHAAWNAWVLLGELWSHGWS